MIFRRHIDAPNLCLIGFSGKNRTNGFKSRHHNVIHIVITMLSVSSDAVKVRIIVEICTDLVKSCICIKICGIGFLHHLLMEIQNLRRIVDDSHLNEFRNGQCLPLDIALIPVIISFVAEILKTDPYGFIRIAYQVR